MGDDLLRYTLRIDRSLFQKFRYVAEFEGRSANKQIEKFIRTYVSQYENKYGVIIEVLS